MVSAVALVGCDKIQAAKKIKKWKDLLFKVSLAPGSLQRD